jgi:sigma-E factor negative regulatory protein RseA
MPDPNRAPGPTSGVLPADPRELLSRLADGDCDGHVTPAACAHWERDAEVRQTWHRYHLIGDVLRSEDLCQSPARDAEFLAGLRQRLAAEPAIVAPLPAQERAERGRRWVAPAAAMAAGFVAVAGLVVVMRTQQASSPAEPAPMLASNSAAAVTSARVADAEFVRDARLDVYLQAHRDMRVNAAAAMPGGGLRNVDLLLAPR